MYWTDISTTRIEKASMDGTGRTVLHSTGLSNAYALTLDYANQILYWASDGYNRIERSSVDGSGRAVVGTYPYRYNPFTITYYNGRIYWADTYYYRVYSTPNTSVSITSVSSSLGYFPISIRVIAEQSQPEGLLQNLLM